MGYKTSPDMKWLVLIGIAQENSQLVGKMQLYSIDEKISQPILGFAADFANITTDAGPLLLFCLANKTPTGGHVQIIKVGGAAEFAKKTVELQFEGNDFPVSMQASSKYDLIYMITKAGFVHVYDTITAGVIYQKRICVAANP